VSFPDKEAVAGSHRGGRLAKQSNPAEHAAVLRLRSRTVSVYEHEHGRPLLSALVVQAGTHQAGDGFYKGLLDRRLDIQLPPDQARPFWREEIRKVVTYWNAAPGEEEPDTQARVLALLAKIESDLKEVRALISAE
jgi:hypothetical protein